MSTALSLGNYTARHGRLEVVHGIDLTVDPGEVVAVLGPNGAGKSSLLESVAGRVAGDGDVWVVDRQVSALSTDARARAGIGLVPTGRGIFGPMSVRENLLLGARLAAPNRRTELLERSIDLFPVLGQRVDARAGGLSGGEQQMVAIARALTGDPRVLLLDEPSQGLAPKVLDDIAAALKTIKETGIGVAVAEQNAVFARAFCSRFVVLAGGVITHGGAAEELDDRERIFASYFHGDQHR